MMTNWKIRVQGYGTFDFEGTEEEAEEMRVHKGRWERGMAIKWRADKATELDRVTANICEILDSGRGVPAALFNERAKLLRASNPKGPS
jgi:hypothetical protein